MPNHKWRTLWQLSLLLLLFLEACATHIPPESASITLTVATNQVGDQAKVLQDIAGAFERENPNIKVNFSAPGPTYEDIMKTKMASNDLPDVFATHGWAKIRYGPFLADLSDQPWASNLNPTIKDAVTDQSGKTYVLPIDQDKDGPVYNEDILNRYGVAVPTTYDELLAACRTIKEKSNGQVIPIHIGGADAWPIGQFFDFFSTSLLISPPQNYHDALRNGTFDWSNYTPLATEFLKLQQLGYLNKDVLTATYSDSAKAFAEGKVAFALYGPYLINEAKQKHPRLLHAGLMPIPSFVAGDVPTFAGGERITWGVWKDSPHLQAAKQFVAFYARPENVIRVVQSDNLPPGLNGINVDLGDLDPYYQKYSDTRVFPFFDRVYLPNGMWDVLCKNGQDLLAGVINPGEFSNNMRREFKLKM